MSNRKPDHDVAALDALLRKVFGTAVPTTHERTPDGVSTQVYRIRRGAETFYLRVAEEPGENLETDAELHRRLREAGVRVPEVVHVEPFAADFDRSIMITTEVPGVPVTAAPEAVAAAVVEAAGADLALLNAVPVDGFGFVRRAGRGWPLQAEHATHPPFATAGLPDPWPGPLATLFAAPALDAIETMLEHELRHPPARAALAHGDFDVTQIFCAGGRYTGIIDFGEIRGTEPSFDLGHFHLQEEQAPPAARLPALLAGYQRVRPLPPDHEESIRRSSVMLAVRQLCRWLAPPRNAPLGAPAVTRRAHRVTQLLQHAP